MASYKDRGNGKTQIIITYGKRFDGKPQRYYRDVEYTTKKQLEIDSAKFLADIVSGKVIAADSTTIDALFNDFMATHETMLSKSTSARYNQIYKNQIKPHLAKRKISTVTRQDIRLWTAKLMDCGHAKTGKPLQPKTVSMALSLLSTLYTYAIYDLELVEKNPCTRIKIQPNKYEKDSNGNLKSKRLDCSDRYTQEEIKTLLNLLTEKLEDPRSRTNATLIILVLFTGLRNGEVMGLKWEDIDLNKRIINICRERLYVSTVGVVTDTPKTAESNRAISVPDFVINLLIQLKSCQDNDRIKMGEDYHESGYVAINVYGEPQFPRNLYQWFVNFQRENGLKKSSVHDLRHTHAAMLSSIGAKIIDVSKRLGHTNTRITQEIYEYLFDNEYDNKISNDLNEYYSELQKCSQNVVKQKTNV